MIKKEFGAKVKVKIDAEDYDEAEKILKEKLGQFKWFEIEEYECLD